MKEGLEELSKKEICNKFYYCTLKEHLLKGEKEKYCLTSKFIDCPYNHEEFKPRRNLNYN